MLGTVLPQASCPARPVAPAPSAPSHAYVQLLRAQGLLRLPLHTCHGQALRQQCWLMKTRSVGTQQGSAADGAADVDPEQQLDGLPRPTQHHQAQLTGKERAALRARSEQMAKDKSLQRVQVGSKGVAFNSLVAIADILSKYEFVRVKLGGGCGLERKQTAQQLAQLLDAAVVGQVGFTITLYRQKGLPRPDSLTKQPAP